MPSLVTAQYWEPDITSQRWESAVGGIGGGGGGRGCGGDGDGGGGDGDGGGGEAIPGGDGGGGDGESGSGPRQRQIGLPKMPSLQLPELPPPELNFKPSVPPVQ